MNAVTGRSGTACSGPAAGQLPPSSATSTTITLRTYASPAAIEQFRPQAEIDHLEFRPEAVDQFIAFEYEHSLSTPVITPPPPRIARYGPIDASAEVVLRFGMLEGTARVEAERCVYDPQSAFAPQPFRKNESRVAKLAESAAIGYGGDALVSSGHRSGAGRRSAMDAARSQEVNRRRAAFGLRAPDVRESSRTSRVFWRPLKRS